MYDVSSRPTFEELTRWFHELETYTSKEVVNVVVGNKVDKEFSRQVTTAEGRAFAERMGCHFIGALLRVPSLCTVRARD